MKVSVVIALCALALFATANAKKVVVCYYGSWSVYRQPGGKVDITDLDPKLCTHMIYTFVGITADANIRILDAWRDYDLKGFENLKNMKSTNPELKVLAAIGGWNEASTNFSPVAANPSLRKTFAKNVVAFLQKHGLDGFDMDWEYPADRGGAPSDKQTFVEMLKDLREAFGSKYLLTAAVGAGKARRESSYDVVGMNKYLDFINLMSYDLHGSWEPQTGHNAPLKPRSADWDKSLTIEFIIKDWINSGASPSKLVLGLGLYGRSFTLANPSQNGFGAPTIGGGDAGKFTQERGSLAYYEICSDKGWKRQWDNEQQVPYAVKGNQWVGYDDAQSIGLKCDTILQNNLAGGMIWSIEQDDVHNACGDGKFPLLREINSKLNGGVAPPPQPTTSAPPPQTASTGRPAETTKAPSGPSGTFKCQKSGYQADPSNCQKFYFCDVNLQAVQFSCAAGLLFDKNIGMCNHAALVKC